MSATPERESRLREAALEASRTGNCVFSVDGKAVFWNTAFTEILDASEEDCRSWATFVRHLRSICGGNGGVAPASGTTTRCWTTSGRFVEIRF